MKKIPEEDSEILELSSIEEEAESNSESFPRIEVTASCEERGRNSLSLPSYISLSEVRESESSQPAKCPPCRWIPPRSVPEL